MGSHRKVIEHHKNTTGNAMTNDEKERNIMGKPWKAIAKARTRKVIEKHWKPKDKQ